MLNVKFLSYLGLKLPSRGSKLISINNLSRNMHHSDFLHDYNLAHIKTNAFQKLLLSAGSSFMCLLDPTRADLIATFGETSGYRAIKFVKKKMLSDPEGRAILQEKPRINSGTVDLKWLSTLPEDTVGHVYLKFLERNDVTPDSRDIVKFVDDFELAYIMQRYREIHDLVHAILGMPTNMLGEVTVKWVEGIQTRLPMCIGGGLFGALRLKPKQRKRYVSKYLPWAIKTGLNSKFLMNIYFEKRWEQPISDLHKELNIVPLSIKRLPDKELTVLPQTVWTQ